MEKQQLAGAAAASSSTSAYVSPRSPAMHLRVARFQNAISKDSKKTGQSELNFIESLSVVTERSQKKHKECLKNEHDRHRQTKPSRDMTIREEEFDVGLSYATASRCTEHRAKISTEDHVKSEDKDVGRSNLQVRCGQHTLKRSPCAFDEVSYSVTDIFPTTEKERASKEGKTNGPQLAVTQMAEMEDKVASSKTRWPGLFSDLLTMNTPFTPVAASSVTKTALVTTKPTKSAAGCGERLNLPSLYSGKNVDTIAVKVTTHGNSNAQYPSVPSSSLPDSPLTIGGRSNSTVAGTGQQLLQVQISDLKMNPVCSHASSLLVVSPRSQRASNLFVADSPTDVGSPMFRSTTTVELHGFCQPDCVTKAFIQGDQAKPVNHVTAIENVGSNGSARPNASRIIKSTDNNTQARLKILMSGAKLLSTQAGNLAQSSNLATTEAYDVAASIMNKVEHATHQSSEAPVSTRLKRSKLQEVSGLMAELRFLKKLESANMKALDDVCDKSANLFTEALEILDSPSDTAAAKPLKAMTATSRRATIKTTEEASQEHPTNAEQWRSRIAVMRTIGTAEANVDAVENVSTVRFSQNGLRLFLFPRPKRPGRSRSESSAASEAKKTNAQSVLSDMNESRRQQQDRSVDRSPLCTTEAELHDSSGRQDESGERFRDNGMCGGTQLAMCGRLHPNAEFYTSQPITPK